MENQNENIIIPERISERIESIKDEAEKLLFNVSSVQQTKLARASFKFHQCSPKDILSEFERAQSVCFVTKYESLPELEGVFITQKGGIYNFENLSFIRHILNEYRSIIQNQNDSIYYQNIHKFIREKLVNKDPSKGLVLSVIDEDKNDVTETFRRYLDERIKSVRLILRGCEYGYIYNGILQHSDHEYTDRFLNEYHSGEINYVFLKHALLLGPIKETLLWHYRVINFLTFPKLGSL
jgi:hypothetical protein